ncbi:MAG: dihydrofolate reductase family protein [Acidimicrobiales bacterium]
MRQVVLQFWISLDGYSCDPFADLPALMEDVDDPEHDEYFLERMRRADTHIMGRNTYQDMAKFWPVRPDHPVAPIMNDTPKVVFSKTLQSADWPESRIASGDTAEEIAKLKAEPGGEILAHGGVQFVQSLARLDLVDEYRLWVGPGAMGKGAPLFTDLDKPLTLRPVSNKAFACGLVELVYARGSRTPPA